MSAVNVASRLTRIIGVFTIALVAAIPLITLSNDASSFLTPDGMKVVASPLFVQMLVFGTTYAAVGEMTPSLVFSFVAMYLVRHFFTYEGGSYARTYVKNDIVKSVQEKIFSYEQPTSS
jgi:hypothetical protein